MPGRNTPPATLIWPTVSGVVWPGMVALTVPSLPIVTAVAFDGMQRTLRTGGRLLLHGYSVDQLAFGTGGPSDPAHLYTDTLLAEAFATMEIEELRSYEAVISEGAGHSGRSALVDLVATKR